MKETTHGKPGCFAHQVQESVGNAEISDLLFPKSWGTERSKAATNVFHRMNCVEPTRFTKDLGSRQSFTKVSDSDEKVCGGCAYTNSSSRTGCVLYDSMLEKSG